MSYLHVERLHFLVTSDASVSYKDPEPLSFSNDLGTFNLRAGVVTVEPADHYASEADARRVIEPS